MLYQNLKLPWRGSRKSKLSVAVHIFVLSICLAASLFIDLHCYAEFSDDKFRCNADNIFSLSMEYRYVGEIEEGLVCNQVGGSEFLKSTQEVEDYVRCYRPRNFTFKRESTIEEDNVLFANPSFSEVFSFGFLKGNGTNVMDGSAKIAFPNQLQRSTPETKTQLVKL